MVRRKAAKSMRSSASIWRPDWRFLQRGEGTREKGKDFKGEQPSTGVEEKEKGTLGEVREGACVQEGGTPEA